MAQLSPEEMDMLKSAGMHAELAAARAEAAKARYDALVSKLSFTHNVDLEGAAITADGTIHLKETPNAAEVREVQESH